MPETITIDRDQCEGLYELVRNHLASIEDFWIVLERTRDLPPPSGSARVRARVRLRRDVERLPPFRVEAGATGAITTASEELIAMKIDLLVPGAEEWNNEICWTPQEGEAITGPDATSGRRSWRPSTPMPRC